MASFPLANSIHPVCLCRSAVIYPILNHQRRTQAHFLAEPQQQFKLGALGKQLKLSNQCGTIGLVGDINPDVFQRGVDHPPCFAIGVDPIHRGDLSYDTGKSGKGDERNERGVGHLGSVFDANAACKPAAGETAVNRAALPSCIPLAPKANSSSSPGTALGQITRKIRNTAR